VPLDGFCDVYEVSESGDVRRCVQVRSHVPAILKQWVGRRGYPLISLQHDKIRVSCLVHQLVARAFLGERPDGYEINHRDGVKTHNHYSNLEYVTRSDNKRHAYSSGLYSTGEAHHQSRISDADAVQMIELHAAGQSLRAIARQFGVSASSVKYTVSGERQPTVRPINVS
jgi:hypothetical protein